jgi:putative DNA primase/helicase
VDDTGNRRWWTIEVDAIYLEHGLDMQQVWAEVYDLWSKDNKTWLSKEELIVLNEKNTEHEKIDPLEEKLLEMFDWSDGWQERVTIECSATQVLEKMGSRMPTQNETYRMGKIITKFTGVKCRRNGKKRLHRLPLYHCDFKEPIFNK